MTSSLKKGGYYVLRIRNLYFVTKNEKARDCTQWNDILVRQILLTCRAVPPSRSETKYCSPAVQFLPVVRKLHGELTTHMLTCRAVPPCRSETTRGTYYTYALVPCRSYLSLGNYTGNLLHICSPAVQILPIARKLHGELTTYILPDR
jgi:hypothetical protein